MVDGVEGFQEVQHQSQSAVREVGFIEVLCCARGRNVEVVDLPEQKPC